MTGKNADEGAWKASKQLNLVHSYLRGPMKFHHGQVQTSTKYLMTFIDDLLMKIQVYNVLSQEQIKYATNIQRI